MRKSVYVIADTQSIALLMPIGLTSMKDIMPPMAISTRVRMMKKVCDDLHAVLYVFWFVFFDRKACSRPFLSRMYAVNIPIVMPSLPSAPNCPVHEGE